MTTDASIQSQPHLPMLQEALHTHAIVWLAAPDGYDQGPLCTALAERWPGPVSQWPQRPAGQGLLLVPRLESLGTEDQQQLSA